MAAAIWITDSGTLGVIPESTYYEVLLDAYSPAGGTLTYKVIAGSLPSGLTLSTSGLISGIPNAVKEITTSTFTIRITSSTGGVADRTFNITIGGLLPPVISPESGSLGNYLDGDFVDIQISATEPVGNLVSVFSLVSGSLPPGLTLTSSGRLYGYITPVPNTQSGAVSGFDATFFDQYPFEFSGTNISRNYQFAVEANDGVKIDVNNFTLYVYTRTNLTADNYIALDDPSRKANSNIISADSIILTADIDTVYNPLLLTAEGSIGTIRQDTLFQFKFDAIDFDNDTLTFNANSSLFPSGLTLNSTTGWLTGVVPYGPLGSVTYPFTANVSKVINGITYTSETKSYSLKIQGQINDVVNWITPSDLGSIYNGDISDFYISATTPSNRNLNYKLVSNSIGRLPIGLELLSDGLISGRVSFQTQSSSQTYSFTVAAYDSNNLVYDEKTFTIEVVKRDQQPYENLYIQALPNRAQRGLFDSIINNSDIFPTESIYRYSDPWYGKNNLRRSLFMTGLNPLVAADYISAMELNHYWKTLNFGAVKTAQALDNNFNVKYEVVYIELLDRGVNASGVGPAATINLPANSENISAIYPNSFPNMVQRIGDGVGYENRSILPTWMTSRQQNGKVLGFTRALVLCYTVPGKSAEIAYRVNQVADTFKLIDFTIDRYEWDNILSDNWVKGNISGAGNISANTSSTLVIGTGTDFANEFMANAILYSSGNEIGNVANVDSSSLVTLDANSLANVSVSGFTYSHTFIVNNFLSGVGTISSSDSSNVIIGSNTVVMGSGTISGVTGNATIIGDSSTTFNSNLRIGKILYVANVGIGTIQSIISANVLILTDPINTTFTNSTYSVTGNVTAFESAIHVGDVITSNGAVLGTVKSITNDFELILTANASATLSNVSYSHTLRDPYTIPGQGNQYLKFPKVGILA